MVRLGIFEFLFDKIRPLPVRLCLPCLRAYVCACVHACLPHISKLRPNAVVFLVLAELAVVTAALFCSWIVLWFFVHVAVLVVAVLALIVFAATTLCRRPITELHPCFPLPPARSLCGLLSVSVGKEDRCVLRVTVV